MMDIDKQIETKESELWDLKKIKDEQLSNKKIKCQVCGKYSVVKNTYLVQIYWYENPHGCMGGDTWHTGETNAVCPKCYCLSRDVFDKKIKELKRYFKQILDYYPTMFSKFRIEKRWFSIPNVGIVHMTTKKMLDKLIEKNEIE